ncbi:MAG: ribulose-phosphate 3-epimerase [Candidatus Gracilibacteria bacterium]
MKVKIAPSILSADFGRLNEEIDTIEPYSDMIHVDIMDGIFVPNKTISSDVVKTIKSEKPLDVHLMIEHPENFLKEFAEAGASILTVHAEACEDLSAVIDEIHKLGVKAGVSIKPGTGVEAVESVLDKVDMVLVMTVEPGFGGQKFMPEMMEKVKKLRAMKPELDIEVDGGINAETAKVAVDAGANVLVAGSYVFGAKDRKAAIEGLRG